MEQHKKASDITFSMFESSGIKFDHSKDNIWQAMFETEADFRAASDAVGKMIERHLENSDNPKISEHIELVLKMDAPINWKVLGLHRVCSAITKSQIAEAISTIPEQTPLPLAKAMMLAVLMK